MNDEIVLNYVKCKNKGIKWNQLPNEINNYLLQRFDDCNNCKESYLRILYNINEIGNCPICGNKLKYQGFNLAPYAHTCGNKKCQSKLRNIKSKQTKLERYGDENYNNQVKSKQTKLERYGDENYCNKEQAVKNRDYKKIQEKIKKTCMERYGTTNGGCSKQALEKIKKTCMERYGVESTWKIKGVLNKSKQTKLERYGNPNFVNQEKAKKTCIEKYGVNNVFKTKEAQEKYKQTCLKNHGVDHNWKIKEEHKLTYTKEALEKKKQTSLLHYGVEYPHQCKEIQNKINETKRKNHTFNQSKPENKSYILLKEKYPDIIRQYKSELYPFCCDFYIPSLDLYIECNYHWTHAGKIYEGTEEDDKILQQWKNKQTQYYDNAIKTWTYYDVEKNKIAKQNNLNYIIFWDINELKDWLKNN